LDYSVGDNIEEKCMARRSGIERWEVMVPTTGVYWGREYSLGNRSTVLRIMARKGVWRGGMQ